MKKCPECGNPSYDGAPVCGNCGYVFPKSKKVPSKGESIFEGEEKKKKTSNEPSTLDVIKENRLIIGAILIITIIAICGIFLMGGSNSNNSPIPTATNDLLKFSEGEFSFNYPKSWEVINGSDPEHPDAKFFNNENNVTIEYYNISTSSNSLKEITQQRLAYAQDNGAYVELVQTVTLDGRNASDIILENADGDYTRFVSMFSNGKLYVFKISGDSINSISSDDITNTINSADIA